MSTFSFVSFIILVLMSSVIHELKHCLAQQFLIGPQATTAEATTTKNKTEPILPTSTSTPTSSQATSINNTIGTESNIIIGSNGLNCSQVVNIKNNGSCMHFIIPPSNSMNTIRCVITIHGQKGQHLSLQLRNISIGSGMFDCEQGSIQLYTLKQGLLYFKNKSCSSIPLLPEFPTQSNVVILTITSNNSTKEHGFELEVRTDIESQDNPYTQYGHSGSSFGLPSIAYIPSATFEPSIFTYEAQGVTYEPASSTYGPPSGTYGPPRATYGPPSATYGPPSATYGPPSATYGPPSVTYRPTSGTYGPLNATYGPPSASYGPPSGTFGSPTATYQPPSATYGPPNTTYGPPNAIYGSPNATYGLPSATYGAPSATHRPPEVSGNHSPTYNPGNHSSFLHYFSTENHFDSSTDHYNAVSGYGYKSEYDHNKGYGPACENDCDKQPWKVLNSASHHQSDTQYNPYSSPLYAWLKGATKPKYWSSELQ